MKNLELRQPSNDLYLEAVKWHESEQLNKDTGAGSGEPGRLYAKSLLKEMFFNPPKDLALFGVYNEGDPVGYVILSNVEPSRKMGDVHITIAPDHQGKGYGRVAMKMFLDKIFESGEFYRVQFQPLKNNTMAVNMGKRLGFKIEAITKSSAWVDNSPRDQTLMRMIRPEWTRIRSGS